MIVNRKAEVDHHTEIMGALKVALGKAKKDTQEARELEAKLAWSRACLQAVSAPQGSLMEAVGSAARSVSRVAEDKPGWAGVVLREAREAIRRRLDGREERLALRLVEDFEDVGLEGLLGLVEFRESLAAAWEGKQPAALSEADAGQVKLAAPFLLAAAGFVTPEE